MEEWPYDLLPPRTERAWLQGAALRGGRPLSGPPTFARMDGGGFWVIEQSFLFHSPDQIRTARAVEVILDGGAGRMIARVSEARFAPGAAGVGTVPFSDDTTFSDGTEFSATSAGATVAAPAALRATTIAVAMIAGELRGGERFSINHPNKGKRLYQIGRIDGETLTIRPPLREAVAGGEELDFVTPGCVCRLVNADDFLGELNAAYHVDATAIWQEAP